MKTLFKWTDEQYETFVKCYKVWKNDNIDYAERRKSYDKCIEILSSIYAGKIVKFVTEDERGTLNHMFKISYVDLTEYGNIICYGISLITDWKNDSIINIGVGDFDICVNTYEDKNSIDYILDGTEASEDEFNREYTKYMDKLHEMMAISSREIN